MISLGARRGELVLHIGTSADLILRRVEGEIRSKGHDDKTAVFDGTTIPLRRWEDWERSRLRKLRREEKRRKDMEKQFGAGFHGDELVPRGAWTRSEYEGSDTGSVFSSDDDVWGGEIGGYNEHNPAFPPPPIALPPVQVSGQTLGHDEMAAILDSGFEDPHPPPTFRSHTHVSSPLQRSAYTPNGHTHDYGYIPETPNMPNSGDSVSSSVESRVGHAKKRSGGAGQKERYGPLGPLADGDDTGWGGVFKGRKI